MAGNIKGITVEIGGDVSGLSKALKTLNKPINATQKELKAIQKGLKFNPNSTTLLAQKQKLLSQSLQDNKTKLQALQNAKAQADAKMAQGVEVNQEQYRALEREIEATKLKIKELATETSRFTQAGQSISNVGKKFTSIGNALKPLSMAAAGIGIASGKLAMDFETAMAQVSTIADATEVPIKDLEKSILELSDSTGVAAKDLAVNVYDAISAGQKTGDAVNFVSNATKLAKAGFTDTDSALDVLTTTLNAYGLEASEVGRISDLLIQTQNDGKVTVGQLSESMGKVIPTAKSAGVSIQQVTASYALLTKNGIASKNATTYLNSMLNELNKSGTTVDKTLRSKTGKSFSQLQADGKSLGDVLQVLSDEAKKNGKGFNDMWGNANSAKAALTLLGDGANTFNDELGKMNASVGATDTAFSKLGTTSVTFKKAINELKNVGIQLGQQLLNVLAPIIQSVASKIKEFSEWFKQLSPGMQQAIAKTVLLTAALSPLAHGIGKALSGIGSICTALGKLSGAAAAAGVALGPLLIAIGAVAVAAVGLGVAYRKQNADTLALIKSINNIKSANDELKTSFDSTQKTVSETLGSASSQASHVETLVNTLESLADASGNVADKDRARAKIILGELNQALGTEYTMTGNQIDNYDTLIGKIHELIKAKQLEATMSGLQSGYDEAIRNRQTAITNLANAQIAYSKALEDAGQAKTGLQVATAIKAMVDAQNEIKAAQGQLSEYNNAIQIYEETQRIALEQGAQAAIDYASKQQLYQQIANESMAQGVDTATTQMRMASIAYAANMGFLAQTIKDYNLGKATLDQVKEAASMVKSAESDFKDAGATIVNGMISGIDGEKVDISSVINDLDSQLVDLEAKGIDLGTSFNTSLKQGIAGNPITASINISTTTAADIQAQGIALGNTVMQKFGLGITNNQSIPTDATTQTVDSAKAAGEGEANTFTSVGSYIDQGIAIGINSSSDIVQAAVRKVVQDAKTAANQEAVIKSPSRLFRDEVGVYIGQGIGVGITKATEFVENRVKTLIDDVVDYSSNYTSTISEITKGALDDEKYYLDDVAKAEGEAESKRFAQRILNATTTEEKLAIVKERAAYRAKISQKEQDEEMTNAISDMNKVLEADTKTKESFITKWQDKFEDAIDAIKDKIDEFKDKLQGFTSSLRGQFDLLGTSTAHIGDINGGYDVDISTLTNFSQANSYIKLFRDSLLGIKDSVPTELFEEIRKLGESDIGKANRFVNSFKSLSEADQKQWIADWQEYRDLTTGTTDALYADETKAFVDGINSDFETVKSEFDSEFTSLETDFTNYGFSMADKFIQGFKDKVTELRSGFGGILDSTSTEATDTMNSASVAPVTINITMEGSSSSAYEIGQEVKNQIRNIYRQAVTAY